MSQVSEIVWEHADGTTRVSELGNGRRRVDAEVRIPEDLGKCFSIETTYPLALIQSIHDTKGPLWVCDDIHLETTASRWHEMEKTIYAYLGPGAFRGKTILEFGCGTGCVTVNIARAFPDARIIGIELFPQHLDIARQRTEYYDLRNITLLQSPSAVELPKDLGRVDFILMPGVYEHMLPCERRRIFPSLWSALRPEGVLFIMDTPNRKWIRESHTSKLPLLNYLPDRLAYAYARRFSKRISEAETWDTLLRRGIRGGSVGELRRILNSVEGGRPTLLKPIAGKPRTRTSLYCRKDGSPRGLKRLVSSVLVMVELVSGVAFVPDLDLAIAKRNDVR
jgi:predicted O-methyltransferase YrrM